MSQRRPNILRTLDGTVVPSDASTLREAVLNRIANNESLKNLDLRKVDLSGANLRFAKFDGSNLAGADFRGSTGRNLSFQGCDLSGVKATGVVWANPSFRQARITSLDGKPARFNGASIRNANWEGATVEDADFAEADLNGPNMVQASFSKVSFKDANLRNGEHRGARYVGNDFSGAKLASAQPAFTGVERRTFTEGVTASGNIYDERTVTGPRVPAFERERERLAATAPLSKYATAGIAIASGAAASMSLGAVLEHDWRGAAGSAIDAVQPALERIEGLGTGLRHLVGYAAAALPAGIAETMSNGVSQAALLAGHVSPYLPDAATAGHLASVGLGVAVAMAVPAAIDWTRENVRDKVRALVGPRMGKLFDRLGAMTADVKHRLGTYKDVVAAFAHESVDRGLLVRALMATSPETRDGAEAPFAAAADGPMTLVVCRLNHLQQALEVIANSWKSRKGVSGDVLLVRASSPGGDEPSALKFHGNGGMTALWNGVDGIRQKSWTAAEIVPLSPREESPAADVRRAFENAILRDYAPEIPFEFDARDTRVSFRHDDGGFMVTKSEHGTSVIHVANVTEPEIEPFEEGSLYRM